MFGIILISHGGFAQGILEAAQMIFGDATEQVFALGLQPDEHSETFCARLEQTIQQADTGNGVVILADLLGGTPCNQAANFASDSVQILTGVNLVMLLEILGARDETPFSPVGALEAAHSGIADYNSLLYASEDEDIL